MPRLLLFLLSLTICVASGYELSRRQQERHDLVLQTEPLNRADTLLLQKHWQEARMLAGIVREQPGLGDIQRARSIEMAAEAALDSFTLQAQAYFSGLISGEVTNSASLAGALTLDLFVIGDLRDLVVQGYKEAAYQQGDEVVMALSAAGLGLALLPELHWAPAILKGLKRAGALSGRFIKMLRKHARSALGSGDFKPLAGVVNDFGRAAEALGPGPVSGAMRAVENESDLATLARAAAFNPRQSYAVATLGGTRGLRMVDKNGRNIGSVARRLKVSSRLAKTASKSLGALSTSTVIVIFCSAVLGMLLAIFGRRKKTRYFGGALA